MKPSAAVSALMTLPSLGFFLIFRLKIQPAFAGLFSDFAAPLPFGTRLALQPATALVAIFFILSGLGAGLALPKERALIFALTAGGGFTLGFLAMMALWVPVFTVVSAIK